MASPTQSPTPSPTQTSPSYHYRPADKRGHTDMGWLKSWFSFSFADYYDPNNMGYQALRVINDDYIAPDMGFGMHGHRDMEIITYLLDGSLEHRDSLGNGDVLKPGDVQRMSAGTGIRHSEFNPSSTDTCHLLQIWLVPRTTGGAPRYEQRHFAPALRQNNWRPLVSGHNVPDTLPINADATLYANLLDAGKTSVFTTAPTKALYLHVATGAVEISGQRLASGDALTVEGASELSVTALEASNVLLFELGK
jgi:quercetin 2,3-dioxygenase